MARKNREAITDLRPDIADRLRRAREEHSKWIHLVDSELTKIPEELFGLTDLESINLSGNRLKTVPERLWDLPQLRSVILIGNPIESLPDRPFLTIDGPTYLRCRNQIDVQNISLFIDTDTPQEDQDFGVAELTAARGLRRLGVGKWSRRIGEDLHRPSQAIQKILDSLGNLDFLESLSLRGLLLETVPEGIRHLRRLKTLRLDALGLKELPDWIGNLELADFTAVDNKLPAVPDSFQRLGQLKKLNLSWNPLGKVPELVFGLISLESLEMRKCNIREIPADILHLRQLRFLDCEGNHIESPPAEVADKGLDAIRDYWRQRVDTGVDYLCEAKLIILGEAGAGKTSLTRKIENPNYKLREREKSTEGIDSYAWNTESCTIVDKLQQALGEQGIRLMRDREEVRYKDSIRDFMRRIGKGKCVVVVISEKYLKSENCMFEMVEVAKARGLRERIFPIMLADANLYKATGRVRYVRYWEDEIKELDEALKTVRGDNLTKLQEDLNVYAEIRRLFDGIADTLRDMNALTPDQHECSGFEELIRRIRAQLGV